ncbi:MAG TPA: acetyl-CoA acetyltransferase [Mycobacterium sp.]|nr:acetyl-CoA acetyltransferase [Mycobacterium sp.]
MAVDPRTPVLIGSGQVNERGDDESPDPVELMATAAREAATARVLEAVDSIRVVNLLSWRYRDPGLLLGQQIGATDFTTRYSGVGGNVPQSLVNQACLDIQRGRADVVLIAGGERWRTRTRLRANGAKPDWPQQDETVPMADTDEDVPLAGAAELRIELVRPAHVYPLFEQALRIVAGESSDEHRRRVGELWSQFSAVAEQNPYAWSRNRVSAEEIWQPRPNNRMICWPYTKLMNSNNMVDQAAAIVLASAEAATRLEVASGKWVFPYAGTDSHDTYALGERADYHRSPAIRIAGRRALELSGCGIGDMEFVDVYSCFPSAVQVAATELGLPLADPQRPLTVTGGLTFAGGPWNNYVTHSIGTIAQHLVENPGSRGLITANGGYLTKHSIGVYGSQPPATEFRWEDVQSEVDREPTRHALEEWEGIGTVEAWTAPYDRDGNPEKAYVAVCTPGDARTLAVMTVPSDVHASVTEDIAGAKVQVRSDGTATLG